MRLWYSFNRVAYCARRREWSRLHPGVVSAQQNERRRQNPEKYLLKERAWRAALLKRHPARNLFLKARLRARKLQVPFALKETDLVIPSVCPVLGLKMRVGGRRSDCFPTLDRVVPALGYTAENVRVISWLANRLKSNALPDQLWRIARYAEDAVAEQREHLSPILQTG